MYIAGNILIAAGILIMLSGLIGLFKFKNFFARILVAAKIDTVGAITLIAGIAVRQGFGFFSLKLLLLIVLMMILNPLVAHIIARSAYLSGYIIDNNSDIETENRGPGEEL